MLFQICYLELRKKSSEKVFIRILLMKCDAIPSTTTCISAIRIISINLRFRHFYPGLVRFVFWGCSAFGCCRSKDKTCNRAD